MVCPICGEIRLSDPEKYLICPKCDNYCKIYSREETREYMKKKIREGYRLFYNLVVPYNLSKIIINLHNFRNISFPEGSFFSRYFHSSLGIGLILKKWDKLNRISKNIDLDSYLMSNIIMRCKDIYLVKHYLFFTKFDGVRLINRYSDNSVGFKYTENWKPYLKRAILNGSYPNDNLDSLFLNKKDFNLFSAVLFKNIILKKLHDKNPDYYYITDALKKFQNFIFHYPWRDYFKVKKTQKSIDNYIEFCDFFKNKSFFSRREISEIGINKKKYINNNWVSSPNNSTNFPIIIRLKRNWYIPNVLYDFCRSFYDLYSSKKKSFFRRYQNDIGSLFEDKVSILLKIFNLDLYTPEKPKKKLVRLQYQGKEFLDIGAFYHPLKYFFIIECKNKSFVKISDYNPVNLNQNILSEFEKFRDRDIPRIKKLLNTWDLDYTIIPLFFNLVPLVGELADKSYFYNKDGITIIQNFAEISLFIYHLLKEKGKSFHEIYHFPEKLMKVINDKNFLKDVDYKHEQDIGTLLGEKSERYLIIHGEFINFDDLDIKKELNVKTEFQGKKIDLSIIIPPELEEYIKDLNLYKGDIISIIVYRLEEHTSIYFLGRIWKL